LTAIYAGVAQNCACCGPRAGCVYAASVRRTCAVYVWLTIWAHVRRNSSREEQHDAERSPMHPRPPLHRPGVAMRSRRGVVLRLLRCCRAHGRAVVCVRGTLGDPAGACALRRHRIARSGARRPNPQEHTSEGFSVRKQSARRCPRQPGATALLISAPHRVPAKHGSISLGHDA